MTETNLEPLDPRRNVVAIVDFTRDSSGIGVVFLVFAAVFLGLGLSGKRRQPRSSPQGD